MKVSELDIYVLAEDYAGFNSVGLLAQHGLSILIRVTTSNERSRYILFDVGQVGDAIIRNSEILKLNLRDVSTVVFSHSHYDHTGGMPEIVKYMGRRVFLVAHPDITKPVIHVGKESVRLNIGLPYSINELKNVVPILTRDPLEIAPGIYYLGEIERDESFVPKFEGLYTVIDGKLVRNTVRDDTGIAINVEGLGLVVVSGCSHSGIVNIVRQACKIVKENPYLVIGGFHLIESKDEFIRGVANELKRLGVSNVVTGHCTGLRAEYILSETFKNNFTKMHVGLHIHLKSKK